MSYYPPGVTGNEYAISGAEREWEEIRECPHCGWEGYMPHESHREIGIRAWCSNPELVETVADGKGGFTVIHCPLTKEGFEVDAPEPEYLWDEGDRT